MLSKKAKILIAISSISAQVAAVVFMLVFLGKNEENPPHLQVKRGNKSKVVSCREHMFVYIGRACAPSSLQILTTSVTADGFTQPEHVHISLGSKFTF